MRRIAALSVALLLSLAVTAPVAASQPLIGQFRVQANDGFVDFATPCPDVAWAGSIVIDGESYGFALVHPVFMGDPWVTRENPGIVETDGGWKIYPEPYVASDFDNGVLVNCPHGDRLLTGHVSLMQVRASLAWVGAGAVIETGTLPPDWNMWRARPIHLTGRASMGDGVMVAVGRFQIH